MSQVPTLEQVQRIACIKWSDGTVTKRGFLGDIEEAQDRAIAWLGFVRRFRAYQEIMVTNFGMDYIWPGEVS